ncbi:MAG: hypothetical protein WA687_11465 [Solirubrobacterales bacterium]
MANRWLTTLLVVLSVALIAAVVIWLVGDDDSSPAAESEIVTATQLPATKQGKTVYWLGERPSTSYELTESPSGRVYIRYLTGGAEAGDERTVFLTVATYPEEDAIAALRRAAREQDGARLGRTDDGAVLLVDPSSPNNAHLAYPGTNLQVEVYSPVPGQALRLASDGAVQPVP